MELNDISDKGENNADAIEAETATKEPEAGIKNSLLKSPFKLRKNKSNSNRGRKAKIVSFWGRPSVDLD